MPNIDKEQKECFDLIIQEINNIILKWQIYKQLFGSSEENIDLLNEYAPICFYVFQTTLWDDILLSFSRLLFDPSTNKRKEINLSLNRMYDLIKNDSLTNELEPIFNKCKKSYEKIKELGILIIIYLKMTM